MEQVAILKPEDKFVIKHKGLVLVAIIKKGVVQIENIIEFNCDNKLYKNKIIGIEMNT